MSAPISYRTADLPWLQEIAGRAFAELREQRLPHALLIGGAAGLGQTLLARELADAALCNQLDVAGQACGQCRSCVLHRQHTHEDFQLLTPLEGKVSIGIDQIRELSMQLSLSPQRAPRQVALIEFADALTLAANNALLKTLEEPPGGALIILVSNQPRTLLSTIRSRCSQMLLRTPDPASASEWIARQAKCTAEEGGWRLALNSGAPLAAVQEADSSTALQLAGSLLAVLKHELSALELVRRERQRLSALRRVLGVVLELSQRPAASGPPLPAPLPELLGLTAKVHSSSLYRVARLTWQSRQWAGSGIREDLQLLVPLEQLQSSLVGGV